MGTSTEFISVKGRRSRAPQARTLDAAPGEYAGPEGWGGPLTPRPRAPRDRGRCGQRPRFSGDAARTATRHAQPDHVPAHCDAAGRRHDTPSTDTESDRNTLNQGGAARAPRGSAQSGRAGAVAGHGWSEAEAVRPHLAARPRKRWRCLNCRGAASRPAIAGRVTCRTMGGDTGACTRRAPGALRNAGRTGLAEGNALTVERRRRWAAGRPAVAGLDDCGR